MSDFQTAIARQEKAAARKAKRAENARFQAEVSGKLATEATDSPKTIRIGRRTYVRGEKTGLLIRVLSPLKSRLNRKRKKRPKIPTLKKLKKTLWAAMTEYVRQRDGSICRICNKNEGYALYHLVPASEGAASKWDAENCVWGCESCNCDENYHRARYARIHEQIFGKEFMDRLWEKSRQTLQLRRPELEAMIADLKAKLPQGETL